MKKYFLGLLLGFISVVGFCNSFVVVPASVGGQYVSNNNIYNFSSNDCIVFKLDSSCGGHAEFYDTDGNLVLSTSDGTSSRTSIYCPEFTGYYKNVNGSSCGLYVYKDLLTNYCPAVDTGEILSGYILESDVDINYCVGNGYCPNECGSGEDEEELQWSALYINEIQHQSAPLINIDIPDYITWDYSSSTGSFDLYVGSGYDVDYIQSIIDINSYRPDSGDFTNIFVGGLTLIFPYIILALFFVFLWKLLKRIFK